MPITIKRQNQNIKSLPQQYQTLMSLLQQRSNSGGSTWGASHINLVNIVTKPHIDMILMTSLVMIY